MQNFDWQVWLVHLFLTLCMTLGYMAMHNTLWEMAFSDETRLGKAQRHTMRAVIPLIDIGIVVALAFCFYMDPMNDHLYQNMQLIVVSIQLLDDRLTRSEFLTRVFIYDVFIVWSYVAYNHALTQLVLGLILLSACAVLLRILHGKLHYNALAVLTLVIANGALYWLPFRNAYLFNRVASIGTYVVVMMFAFMLWTSSHNERLRRGALKQRADFDSLTNARTYARFHVDMTDLVARMQATGKPLTMVMLDIDHFKAINDRYGHLSGNDVLVGVSTLLDRVLGESGLRYQIYRTGGEEFNIVFANSTPTAAMGVVRDCWAQVRTTQFAAGTSRIHVSISVGMTAMRPGENAQDMFRRADNSLYLSKRHGRDTITVESQTLQLSDKQLATFTYTYFTQPIVDMRDGSTVRSELLLRMYDDMVDRWRLPQDFDINAATMMNLLHKVIHRLDLKVMNLNLLPQQFLNAEIIAALGRFAKNAPLDGPLRVELVDLPPLAAFKDAARLYHAAGIRIIIDDVGSDNSYAASKAFLPYVDGVKFAVQNLRDDHDDDALQAKIEFWLQLARTNNLDFVMEGVETKSDVQLGLALGVVQGQGYYYAKPELPR